MKHAKPLLLKRPKSTCYVFLYFIVRTIADAEYFT